LGLRSYKLQSLGLITWFGLIQLDLIELKYKLNGLN